MHPIGVSLVAERQRNYAMLISVWLGRGCTASPHGKSGEGEADAEKGEGSRLRHRCSQKAVLARAVDKNPGDLPRIVDAGGRRTPRTQCRITHDCAWHVELGETAAGVEEAVAAHAVVKEPDDLCCVVDTEGSRKGCTRHVEWGEAAAGVEEAVGARAVGKNSGDLPRVVDAAGLRSGCAGHVEWGEAAAVVEEAVGARAVGQNPDNLRCVVDTEGLRRGCAGRVEWDDAAAGVEEAVSARAVGKNPDDLPRVVDAAGRRKSCAGHVELGEAESGGICGRAGCERSRGEDGGYGEEI